MIIIFSKTISRREKKCQKNVKEVSTVVKIDGFVSYLYLYE